MPCKSCSTAWGAIKRLKSADMTNGAQALFDRLSLINSRNSSIIPALQQNPGLLLFSLEDMVFSEQLLFKLASHFVAAYPTNLPMSIFMYEALSDDKTGAFQPIESTPIVWRNDPIHGGLSLFLPSEEARKQGLRQTNLCAATSEVGFVYPLELYSECPDKFKEMNRFLNVFSVKWDQILKWRPVFKTDIPGKVYTRAFLKLADYDLVKALGILDQCFTEQKNYCICNFYP